MLLKTRIFLLAPIAIAGMIIVGLIFYAGSRIEQTHRTNLDHARQMSELDSRIEILFLEARRAEKDFIVRSDAQYIDRHHGYTAETETAIKELRALAETYFPGQLDEQIPLLEGGFARYRAGFEDLAATKLALGLDENSGLQGALRSAVHDAEASLETLEQPELMVKMLMMRRHEKDFMLRIDEKYVGRLDERVAEFEAFPVSYFGSPAARDEITGFIETYQTSFHAFSDATFREMATRETLSAAFSIVEPAFEEIKAHVAEIQAETQTALDQATRTVFMTVIGVCAVAMLLIGAITLMVARSVGKPLTQTTRALNALAEGENDVTLDGKTRKDEIGEIARAFEAYQALVIRKAKEEQDAADARDAGERARQQEQARRDAEQKRNLEIAVGELGGALDRLASGDLTVRIETQFVDALDRLRTSFNSSVDRLAETLGEVKTNISTVHDNSGEIRSAVERLSNRTEQQAAALEETSAALEEITSTVKNSSTRAQEATEKAAEARGACDSSTKVVSNAVNAMSRIESASSEIAQIIGVIDEIAFQTNLLALNAGVEAARAGEAGKGFAVVAQEVRELAQRAASAAKDIKNLIGKSTGEVENGVKLVTETGEVLTQIANHVADINTHISAIALAAREQATGLDEINSAVSQMDQVTQQNAAMAEETTAVTHSLASEADALSKLVGRFELGHRRPTSPVPAAVDRTTRAAPVASPAKAIMNKVRNAFSGNTATAAAAETWEEF
jgi:methyl-accepting chemotaxis protein